KPALETGGLSNLSKNRLWIRNEPVAAWNARGMMASVMMAPCDEHEIEYSRIRKSLVIACLHSLVQCRQSMPAKSNVQYTVRGIPKEVDQALGKKPQQRKVSLNRLLIEELTSATGATLARTLRSLDALA